MKATTEGIERKIQLDQARPRYDRYSRTGSLIGLWTKVANIN